MFIAIKKLFLLLALAALFISAEGADGDSPRALQKKMRMRPMIPMRTMRPMKKMMMKKTEKPIETERPMKIMSKRTRKPKRLPNVSSF